MGGRTVTLTNDTVTGNDVEGGFFCSSNFPTEAQEGAAFGGGIEFASAATASLDLFTATNTSNNDNVDLGDYDFVSNIDGTYIPLT